MVDPCVNKMILPKTEEAKSQELKVMAQLEATTIPEQNNSLESEAILQDTSKDSSSQPETVARDSPVVDRNKSSQPEAMTQDRVLSANQTKSTQGYNKGLRRSYWKLFTTGRLGLGIISGAGRRNGVLQSDFRSKMIKAYGSANPDPQKKFIWCPILKYWFNSGSTSAAHLFAYVHGQEAIEAIFSPDASLELFSPSNGLLIASIV
ncbi:MAG: hypothetical protein MMC33_001796 [Icmadophila ericetorum]|nr:hypothetical protein [Icmadophila ericetorum]